MRINTVSDLVDKLGGSVKVAAALGVTSSQVSNMRHDRRIPPKHYFVFRQLCDEQNIDLPQKFFADRLTPAVVAATSQPQDAAE